MRLKTKIIAILLPILIVQGVAFFLPSSMIYERYFKAQINSHTSDYVSQLASAFDTHLQRLSSDSLLFSKNHTLMRYLSIEDQTLRFQVLHRPLLSTFSSFQEANPEYFEISLILPDGYEEVRRVNTGVADLTDEEQDTFYIQAFSASDKDFVVLSGINPDDQQWALMAGRRVYIESRVDNITRTKRFAGWLVIKTNFRFLKELVNGSRFSEQGHLILFHNDGRIIWQSTQDSLFAKQHRSYIRNTVSVSSENSPGSSDRPVSELASYKNNSLLSTRHPLTAGLNLDVAWPASLLTSIMAEMGRSSILLSVLVAIASMAVLFFVLNRILIQPIFKLVHTARHMGNDRLPDSEYKADDELGDLYCTLRDMGRRLIKQKQSLQNIAFQDSLTDLPNRRRFLDQLESRFAEKQAVTSHIALLFIDLDGFKQVNDRYGHHAGDAILREVADRLMKIVRSDDIVEMAASTNETSGGHLARLGGDEFTLLLNHVQDFSAINNVADRILASISRPFIFDGQELYLSASIGIAVSDVDNKCAVDLLKNADAAMYHAKQNGKNTFHYFDRSIAQQLFQKLELKNQLRKAIENTDLSLAYQPQISAQTGALVGVEALVRWKTPEMGWIRPDIFIPIAEDAGLISQLGRWVMHKACWQTRQWQQQGLPVVPVSVNVSNLQFNQEDMSKTVFDCLAETHLSPELLKLEITESSIMQGTESINQLRRIRESGVRVSLDDFGTGYSSLSALRGLPIDQLKIDKSFIADVGSGEDGKAIVSAIIAMARQLHLEVVAEGVETEYELEFVREQHADIIQGYYYSKPLTAEGLRQSCLLTAEGLKPECNVACI